MSAATCCSRTATRFDGDAVGGADRRRPARSSSTPRCRATRSRSPTPATRGQIIIFTYPLIGNYGVSRGGDGVRPIHARAVVMREGDQPRGRAAAPRAAGSTGSPTAACPAITRRRHARARAPHPRHGRDARRRLPGASCRRPRRGARSPPSRRWPAPTSRARSRRASRSSLDPRRRRGPTIVAIDTGIKDSIVAQPARARRAARAAPVHDVAPRSCSARDPDAFFLANGPGDPAALDYVVEHGARAGRQACRCSASASATSCSAARSAWRRSSCRSATAAPTTRSRTSRPAGSRSPARTTASRCSARAASARSRPTSRCAGRPTSAPPS